MQKSKKRSPEAKAENLTMLMRATVEARTRLWRARERLRAIDAKLRGADEAGYERQHNQALAEYIEAVGRARRARTELVKTLKQRNV